MRWLEDANLKKLDMFLRRRESTLRPGFAWWFLFGGPSLGLLGKFSCCPDSWKLDRGFYFSKTGSLIPTIAKWSWCHCRLVSLHLSAFLISILACSWLPLPPCLPSFVSLHDLHAGLLLAAAAALSPFICPLHDLHSGLLLGAAAALSPFICLSSYSLSFVSQCCFLCPPPPASHFIAFHLSPSFFGNAIGGLDPFLGFAFTGVFL